MEAFITALTAQITVSNLWGAIAGAAALIGAAVLFSIGYRITHRSVSGISKGKAKM